MGRKKSKDKELSWAQSLAVYWKALRLMAGKQPMLFCSAGICSVVSALSPYVTVYLSAQIINELAGARDSRRLTELIVWTVGSSALLGLLQAVLGRWKNRQNAEIYFQREKLYTDKLFDMDYADMDDQSTHALLSQIEQLDRWSGWGLGRVYSTFENGISNMISILGAAALSAGLFAKRIPKEAGLLTVLDHPLCIVLILLVLLTVTFLAPMFENRANRYWSRMPEDATFANRLFSFYGHELPMSHERALDARIYKQEDICLRYDRKYNIYGPGSVLSGYAKGPMGMLSFLSSAISSVLTGLVYGYVCLKAWAGAFGVGSVTQYIGAITSLSGGIYGLISNLGQMRTNAVHLKTTFRFLDMPSRMYQGSLTTEKRSDRQYEVEFKNVSFRYPGASDYALRNMSMKFKVGRRLAVVGENGSGKTTFIKLLCRLYDPTEGEILLNGIDIRKYQYDDYMNIFSVVFQDFQLLGLPLGENVAAGMQYDRERAAANLRDAGFGERLGRLSKGLDTSLHKELSEDGVEISGGEAQKIAIARALYKDAPFIILDEPTAALDPVAESEIYAGFDRIVGDKTAIYISHRLSSCRFCDEIAVFDAGRVIQQGSHEALVEDQSGKYYALWHAQAQYYTA